ncbi:MAG: GIDE domain-containing protein [Kofleriaceae bacterium]
MGLVVALGGVIVRRRAGKISAAPLVKTGDLAKVSGAASCEGTVRAQQELAAPCTNTACVYFKLTIEKQVKERRGSQSQTRWKKLADHHQGSVFALDDGSGQIFVQATDDIDGELEQTFKGSPPGTGLGAFAAFVPNLPTNPNEEILGYRITESVIRNGAKVYVLGAATGGQLKPGATKLTVSTRGRDAMVGSANRKALLLMIFGGLATVGGATVAVVRPGEARACGTLKDTQTECAVSSSVVDEDRRQPDGSKKREKFRREILSWEVTKAGKYELAARDPKQGFAVPTLQVENSIGLPMNIDLGLALGAGRYSTVTKTAQLAPGTYKIYVFSHVDGPSRLLLEIRNAK